MKISLLSRSLVLTASLLVAFATEAAPLNAAIPANNEVGLVLMKEISKAGNNEKNIMTSPLSMYLALSLAQNGTAAVTKEKLAEYLGADAQLTTFNDSNKALQNALAIQKSAPLNEWNPKPPVLGIYNSAWNSSNKSASGGTFAFAPNYVQIIKDYYGAEVQSLDFLDPKSADVINAWANEKTAGLIPTVLDADTLQKMMWVLLNATYLEASWQVPFFNMYAPNAPKFQTLDGGNKTVPMISVTDYLAHGNISKVEYIEVPFFGADLAFYIAVPRTAGEFKSLNTDKAWAAAFWKKVMSAAKGIGTEKGELQMPKFSFSYSVALKKDEDLTQAVGLNFLFEDQADFSALAAPGSTTTAVGLIKQDTKIELDEYGVKAAAVTMIGGIETTSVQAGPSYKMVVDKPFFFAIGSKGTGALLFVGSVVDPTLTN